MLQMKHLTQPFKQKEKKKQHLREVINPICDTRCYPIKISPVMVQNESVPPKKKMLT